MTEPAYEGWALVEQLGHRQTVGQVREVEQYGTKMLRIDVPAPDGAPTTLFVSGASIYQVTPLSLEVANGMLKRQADIRPIAPMNYALRDQRKMEFDTVDDGDDPEIEDDEELDD